MEATAPANKKVPGRPWAKGQSGNPKGRPKGSLNKSTIGARRLAQKFVNEAVEPVFQKLVQMAKDGDPQALRLVVERILPVMNIEVVLREPDWLKLAAPEIVTISGEELSD